MTGVGLEEVDCDDALGLVGSELSPGWAGAARGGVDAGRVEDFHTVEAPTGCPALDPPMSPAGIVLGQA
jgi:hypothetical protein